MKTIDDYIAKGKRRRQRALKSKRKALISAGDLTDAEWRAILRKHHFRCAKCGAPYEHMDHIIPLSRGGTHTKDNVQPLCAKCNLEKGAKDA